MAGGHADARGDRVELAAVVEGHGLAQRFGEALGERVELCMGRFDENDELVTAEAAHGVLPAGSATQALGERAQQLVSRRVTEAVIDVLEPVDVDE